MLKGIEVGGILNTVKETVLLRALKRQEDEEYLKTLINYKSGTFDVGSAEDRKNVRDLFQAYEELRDPTVISKRDESVNKHMDKLKALEKMEMPQTIDSSKTKKLVDFTKSKKSGEIKII